jgi:phage antirepressor YoqD-like protein
MEEIMKNALQILTATQTMTLKEITDLLEIDHSKAMKKVTVMSLSPEFGTVAITATVYNKQGQTIDTFLLDKRQSIAVAGRLNTPMLMRVIDRWQELENKSLSIPNFSNPVEAARAWADQFEKNQNSLALIEVKDAQIHVKDHLIIASNEASIKAGEVMVREFVKTNDLIDIGEKLFYQWMRDQNIIMQHKEPYQKFVNLGYFHWKPSAEEWGGKIRHQLYITPRGKVWLAAKYMAFLDSDLAA